jgi:TATA-box binding protein (TBP) (component of TFIID and TFIIIB)
MTTSALDGYERTFIADIFSDADHFSDEPRPKRGRGGGGRARGARGRGRGRGRKTAAAAEGGGGGPDAPSAGDSTVVDEDEHYVNLPDFVCDINKQASEAFEMGDEASTCRLSRTDDPSRTIYDVRGRDLFEWAEENAAADVAAIDAADLAADPRDTSLIIYINNVVVVTETGTHFNCERIVARDAIHGWHYNQPKFAAAVAQFQNPAATSMVFPTGIITQLGTNNLRDAMFTTQHVLRVIGELRDEYGRRMYPQPLRVQTVALSNVVASMFLFFRVDLNKLIELPFVRYEDSEFIGCILDVGKIIKQFERRRVKVLVFSTGAVVFTGTKSSAEVYEVQKATFPHLARCAELDAHGRVVRVSREEQLRTRPELRRAMLLPAGSREVIRLNLRRQVALFDEMKIGKLDMNNLNAEIPLPLALSIPGGAGASNALVLADSSANSSLVLSAKKVARKRGNAESGASSTLGKNIIASSTIGAHNERELSLEAEREQLRQNLRSTVLRKRGVEPSKKDLDAAERRAMQPKATKLLPVEEAMALIEEDDVE